MMPRDPSISAIRIIVDVFPLCTLRKLVFHFLSNWMGSDRGDSFPFDFEPNGFPFGSKSKRKLLPWSYPIECERKWNVSFLSASPWEHKAFGRRIVPVSLQKFLIGVNDLLWLQLQSFKQLTVNYLQLPSKLDIIALFYTSYIHIKDFYLRTVKHYDIRNFLRLLLTF